MMIKQFACVATLLSLGTFIPLVAIAPASFANPPVEKQASPPSSDPPPTLRQGIPGRRVGGGTRSDALFTNASDFLTAITAQSPLTITAASHPKLLFYVPEMLSDNTVEFVLRDRQDTPIYETTFSIAREAGIVSVDLAESGLSELNLNEDYQWYFSIVPDALDRANDVVVHGSIRRVDPEEWLAHQPTGGELNGKLSEQLATAEPLEQARILYQQANLWHDAALLLSSLYQADPKNVAIATEWNQLLQSVGLLNIASITTISSPSPFDQSSLQRDLQANLQ